MKSINNTIGMVVMLILSAPLLAFALALVGVPQDTMYSYLHTVIPLGVLGFMIYVPYMVLVEAYKHLTRGS